MGKREQRRDSGVEKKERKEEGFCGMWEKGRRESCWGKKKTKEKATVITEQGTSRIVKQEKKEHQKGRHRKRRYSRPRKQRS